MGTWASVRLIEGVPPNTGFTVRRLTESSTKKTCILDPVPTSLVIGCTEVLLPVLMKIVNLSLESGTFADNWKCALVNLLLKKPGLDLVLNNYRPVSNLQYVSKLTERAVFNQVHDHLVANCVYPVLQSAFRPRHSRETALVRVMNDTLLAMNSQQVTLLVLLDLSAAFDTVNYEVLLKQLHTDVGIRGKALDWFESYVTGRSDVPQGSYLGPLLFVIYSSNLFKIVEKHLSTTHCLADDTQLYLSFKPGNTNSQNDAISAMNKCVHHLRNWMITDRLMINDAKTEFLSIRTRQQLAMINTVCSITVGEYDIDPSWCVRNLGVWFVSQLRMSTHLTKRCNSAFNHLHNIRWIRKYISLDSLLTLIHAFITCRLDYCYSLL